MQSLGLVYDALLANPLTSGPLAFTVVPDLAVAVPVPTEGGKSFAFRLRPGRTYTYSDGRPVRASDFRRAIERLFRIGSDWSSDYRGIVGAAACTRTRCDLRRGIVTDDRAGTVVFHLTAPDRNFLTDLTYLASAPVPAGIPLRDAGDSIPGTGPYRFASSNNGRTIYVRNPRFHEWSHAAQPDGSPDEIVMRYGMGYAQEARAVERDQADWTSDPIPPALLAELKIRFASQLHYRLMTDTDFLELNTTIPPFDDVRVRQALNFAIDRGAIVQAYGGRSVATPTCQILPPGILGFHRYCPYTVDPRPDGRWHAPNLALAKQLIRASGTRGDEITVWGVTEDPLPDVIRDVAAVLRRLGFRARARFVRAAFPDSLYSTMQIRYAGDADTTPDGFFGWWFLCNSTANHHWFCDPRLDAQIARAEAVEAADPRAADGLWARIDRALVDRATWVPLVNPHWADLVSTHVHDYESFPNLGLIADQVTLR